VKNEEYDNKDQQCKTIFRECSPDNIQSHWTTLKALISTPKKTAGEDTKAGTNFYFSIDQSKIKFQKHTASVN
jgi:hypothetical protein